MIATPKHTPGPWETTPMEPGIIGPVEVCTRRHLRIATVLATALGATESDRANAHLIAAAPDLLAALKAIQEHCPCDQDSTRSFEAAWKLLEAAIAKAEGPQ